MAQHKSAEKRHRQTVTRTEQNRARVGAIRTFVKKAEAALTAGDKKTAQDAVRTAESALMKGVSKGVLKKSTASRKVSRLSAKVKALA